MIGSADSTDLDALVAVLEDGCSLPGVGSGAAIVVSLSAGLVQSVARESADRWAEARGASSQAGALRRRGLRLAKENAAAHAAAQTALRPEAAEQRGESLDARLGTAMNRAAESPLAIVAAAMDTVDLALFTAERGMRDQRADALGAAQLAASAAATARYLVDVNLVTLPEDQRVEEARRLASLAQSAVEEAVASGA